MRVRSRSCLLSLIPVALAALFFPHALAQDTPSAAAAYPPVVHLTAEQDLQRTLDLLHITALRPGRTQSHPENPNYVNYDESKANPFPVLPDPLVLKNGKNVTTAKIWWTERRPQLVELFDREMYGRIPAHVPRVTWAVNSTEKGMNGGVPIVTRILTGHIDNSSYPLITVDIQLKLTTPAYAARPVPVIMEFVAPPAVHPAAAAQPATPTATVPVQPTWQQQVLAKGWGYAEIDATSIQADSGAGLTEGIIGLCNKGQPRKLDNWGVLRAWAWGASRALDYLETDKAVNAKKVGIEGTSRYGKAALVTMAYDTRFAIASVNSSGEGGAKLSRRNFGETVENLAGVREYQWMDGNFLKYAGPLQWGDLPVDAHELIALCAPRPVFIGGGATKGDGWVDARGMFMAEVAAGPVYRLLDKKDLGTSAFPPIETALIGGNLAFRQHSAGHTPVPNWPTFVDFASRFLGTYSFASK
jgi:hypothetical protein